METVTKHDLFSVETEKAALGALLIDPSAIERVSFLQPTDFKIKTNEWIYEAILRLHHEGQAIDTLTICNELDRCARLAQCGGAAHLTELLAWVPSALHVQHYAMEVASYALRRRLTGVLASAGESGPAVRVGRALLAQRPADVEVGVTPLGE